MKNKLTKKVLCMALAAASVFSLVGCGQNTTVETTTPVQTVQQAPERGEPDRSNLPYLSAIEDYRKSDWTANWIWTKGCSDDSYVAFRKTVAVDAEVTAMACISAVDK